MHKVDLRLIMLHFSEKALLQFSFQLFYFFWAGRIKRVDRDMTAHLHFSQNSEMFFMLGTNSE